PHAPQPAAYPSVWTPEEQARHRAELLAALDAHDADVRDRHLRAVPDAERGAA
ncbi:hypothetical protein G5C65_38315, partial [Streptomyces sp. SB3404]|nr:hypothetical protein [Streptomyces boncukensis]